jgi:hypothetical protein
MNGKFNIKPRTLKLLLVATVSWCLMEVTACSTPLEKSDHLAVEAGFTKTTLTGTQFQHVIYQHHLDNYQLEELHIYIEGDGTPWISGQHAAVDPTPGHPLALELMREDPAPALYLGRPCYFGLSSSTHCSMEYWTSKRYAPEVVASMLSIIQQYQEAYQVQTIVLIGYSGGGALATLLSRELQGKQYVITLAANLDTDLWTQLHGYLPLTGSLNPVNYRSETAHIPQLHLAGLQDETVPAAVTRSYAVTLDPKFFRYYPAYNHTCCWLELWPAIIAEKPWASITAN